MVGSSSTKVSGSVASSVIGITIASATHSDESHGALKVTNPCQEELTETQRGPSQVLYAEQTENEPLSDQRLLTQTSFTPWDETPRDEISWGTHFGRAETACEYQIYTPILHSPPSLTINLSTDTGLTRCEKSNDSDHQTDGHALAQHLEVVPPPSRPPFVPTCTTTPTTTHSLILLSMRDDTTLGADFPTQQSEKANAKVPKDLEFGAVSTWRNIERRLDANIVELSSILSDIHAKINSPTTLPSKYTNATYTNTTSTQAQSALPSLSLSRPTDPSINATLCQTSTSGSLPAENVNTRISGMSPLFQAGGSCEPMSKGRNNIPNGSDNGLHPIHPPRGRSASVSSPSKAIVSPRRAQSTSHMTIPRRLSPMYVRHPSHSRSPLLPVQEDFNPRDAA